MRPRIRLPVTGSLRVASTLLLLAVPAALGAQSSVSGIPGALLREVMPDVDRFETKAGSPPVIRAYRGDALAGFVFETADIPPEQLGYSGPVQAVVGLALDGTVTGARVTEYRESYRSSMGDFLRRPGVQEQFRGKALTDPFLVNGDVERVTRATISTQALARGIRDASRRVAEVYAAEMEGVTEPGPMVLEEMSWFEMRTRGVLKRILIEGPEGHLDISMAHLPDDSVAEFFLGATDVERMHAGAERWEVEDPVFIMYALEGPRLRYFLRDRWHVAQDGDTLALRYEQVYHLGMTDAGRVADESVLGGVFMLDRRVDASRPFDLLYDFEGHEGYYAARFDAVEPAPEERPMADDGARPEARGNPSAPDGGGAPEGREAADDPDDPDRREVAEEAAQSPRAPGGEAPPRPDADEGGDGADDPGETADAGAVDAPEPLSPAVDGADSPDGANPPGGSNPPDGAAPPDGADPGPLELGFREEGSELSRTLAATRWGRVGRTAVVVALALAAFFLKTPAVAWLSMAATLLVLGFADASFLSVSHLTAAVWVGPGVFLRDLPLLLLVVATILTTLVWGRVFCGFLCPFGVLQELLEQVVPRRLRRRIPPRLHRAGLRLKYVLLAVVLVPALLGSHASLYQWFEPFGTVFFPSRSAVLWAIAGVFLLGAALVPRFYCRYACPLGAALALVSTVAPRRIGRVEQCRHCVVCQQDCPTGAIRGAAIDFPECVRCNRCETNLRDGAGTCRHDMDEIRPRLVQIRVGARGEPSGG